jgi:radical SAM protein with 4Fe4S-binding SPASM domain
MATIPAATPLLTQEVVRALHDAGLDQMALSLDFSTAEAHDRFRGAVGAFDRVMEAVGWAHQVGLPVQINTVISAQNLHDVDQMLALVSRLGIVFWEVFFLVPIGRGTVVQGLTAEQYETVFAKLYDVEQTAPFVVKATEAFQYHRYRLQRQTEERQEFAAHPVVSRWHGRGPGGSIGRSREPVNAGKGHCFVSSTGEVYPSGFLPVPVGHIREHRLGELYRTAPVLRELRDPELLKGRCGACEFRSICGGSRARAYAMTGDYLAEDPCCADLPPVAPIGRSPAASGTPVGDPTGFALRSNACGVPASVGSPPS